jgi:hypothetical protein
MSWSLKFDEPISLAKGKPLRSCVTPATTSLRSQRRKLSYRIGNLRRSACWLPLRKVAAWS